MKKYNKFDYLNIFLIITSFFVILIIMLKNGNVFYASTKDYSIQHYLIPEYFRTLFYETKDLIPSLALNLGMGQNIFNFSYYGLLNPFILFSYLLPFINMASYLEIISILVIVIDIILFYYWISRKHEDKKIRFITTFLFIMATPLILHSHRHIMFVNYMPFLLMGLIGIENYIYKNKKVLLMLSSLLIITTSYFFSIPALITMFLYGIFLYLNTNKQIKIKVFLKKHLKLAWLFIVPILISGVLLLPTLKAILNSRFAPAEPLSIIELLIPNFSFNPVLYNSYSMGLTSIIIIAIINSILTKNKAYRFLGIIFTLIMTFPIIEYLLNGLMYLNAKVFIPFIPLGILLIAKLIEDLTTKKANLKIIIPIFIIISIIGCLNFKWYLPYIIDATLTTIAIIILEKTNKKNPLIITLVIISFSASLIINTKDELTPKEIKNNQYDKTINNLLKETAKDQNLYRTVDKTNEFYSANNIRNIEEYKTTMYSSLTNKHYKNFYWNTFDTENPNRNDALFSDVTNPLFNIYTGNKYYLTNSTPPIGYQKIKTQNEVSLYKNDDVFSIGYVSNNLMSEKEFNKLKYPYNIEALLNYIIINDKQETNYQTNIKKTDPKISNITNATLKNNKYNFKLEKDQNYTIKKEKNNKNKISIITFDMEYPEKCKNGDTAITINDVTNKLTCKGWKYHNQNYNFSYILSPNEKNELNITITKGNYIISNIKTYELDYQNIKQITKTHEKFIIDKTKTKGDIIEGHINVTKDNSYFNLVVPYDEGYNIYVDGKQTPYEKTNTSFIGFKITKGYHDIKIEYTAPWLNLGKAVSLIGIMSFILTIVVSKGVKKHEKNINDHTML